MTGPSPESVYLLLEKKRRCFKSLDDKIERLRDSFQARFDKLTYWATGIIVTILLAAGYIGHR